MAASDENGALFPIFLLSTIALPLIPYTILKLFGVVSKKERSIHCDCSVCSSSSKYQKSKSKQLTRFLTCHNFTVLLLWIVMGFLACYIKNMKSEIEAFEPFGILGLEPGVSESEIKKAYRNLSRQYHPDKNPDPEANKYFVEYISKAYQALTDPISRENFEKYGHPDGRQGFEIGIALPQFLLNMKGESGGILLLCFVGVVILLPLVIAVVYLARSSRYAGSFVRRETISSYYKLIKHSLTHRKLFEVFLEADEFKSIPVRKTDENLLQKLFASVKDELNLTQRNLKQEESKFFDRHPALVKTELLIQAYLTRQTAQLSLDLQRSLNYILQLAPRLLEELVKLALVPHNNDGHGWLRPSIEAIEISQCILQAVRFSSRKTAEGVAPFFQLPHFTENVVEKMSNNKKVKRFQEFQDMDTQERMSLLNGLGFSSTEALDVQKVLDIMPCTSIEVTCQTEGEEGIQEGDVVTLQSWVTLKRGNGLIRAVPHTPNYPFNKLENFWFLLADTKSNNVWFSKNVSFTDESAAITAASRAVIYKMEMMEASTKETNAAVKDAVNRVKNGSRLVLGKFLAPKAGSYDLKCYLMCDTWIGCDKTMDLTMKVLKHNKIAPRIEETRVEDNGSEEEEEDETDEDDDEDYESEYSEDDDDDDEEVIETKMGKKETKKGTTANGKGKGKEVKNTKAVSNQQNRKKKR